MSESPKSKHEALVHALISSPLELPDGSSFSSVSVRMDIKEMVALSERYLPIVNSQPDFVERKIREAIDAPFIL